MKKKVKILLGLLGLVFAVAAGLSLFVRFYLTEDRLKGLLIPPVEQALARKVSLGTIDVGIFRGITINDLVIKEADGEQDFVRTKAFILSYEFLPLLSKKLLISEVRLLEPEVRITRDNNGIFNFAPLPFLAKKPEPSAQQSPATGAGALPLALTINQIRLDKAKLSFKDAKNELPSVEVAADLTVAVNFSPEAASLSYVGDLRFTANVMHGQLAPQIQGQCHFDTKNISLLADIALDREQLHLDSSIEDYRASPKIRLDLTSEALDLDHLMALAAGIPAAEKAARQEEAGGAAAGNSLPPNLNAHGKIQVAKAVYKNLNVTDFLLNYTLQDGIFTIPSLTANAAGGQIQGEQIALDLNRPDMGYAGALTISGLQIEQVAMAFAPKTPDIIGGKLDTSLKFSGHGTVWQEIQKVLTVDGTYTMREAWLRDTEMTRTVSSLVGLQELNNLSFQNIDGTVHLANGMVRLASNLSGEQLDLQTQGDIGLDGSLNLPLTIKLSSLLSEKLRQRVALAKYLADESGKTVVKLTVTGTIKQPRPVLDPVVIQEQTEKVLKDKVYREIDRVLQKKGEDPQKPDPARELLRGLFGK